MFKPLTVAAALSLSFCAQAEPLLYQHPYDYLSHAAGGAAITVAGDYLGQHPLVGVGIAAAVGVAKEALDKHFDAKDAAAWAVGAGLAALGLELWKNQDQQLIFTGKQILYKTSF